MKILRLAIAARLAASAAVGAGVAAAAPASADADAIQYVSKILSVTPARQMLATVGCPAVTFVVSASASGRPWQSSVPPITSLAPVRNIRTSQGLANYTSVAVTGTFGTAVPGTPATVWVQAACAPTAQLSNAHLTRDHDHSDRWRWQRQRPWDRLLSGRHARVRRRRPFPGP